MTFAKYCALGFTLQRLGWFNWVAYHWGSPREVWAFGFMPRLLWGRCHAPYTRTWSLGPFTLAHTNLDRF